MFMIAKAVRNFAALALIAMTALPHPTAARLETPKGLGGKLRRGTHVRFSFHYSAGLFGDKDGFQLKRGKVLALQSLADGGRALKGGTRDGGPAPGTPPAKMVRGRGAKL